MDLTTKDKIRIVKLFHIGNSLQQTADVFSAENPEKVVNKSRVRRIINRFEETGCVANHTKQEIQPIENEFEEIIIARVEVEPTISLRSLQMECGISRTKIARILKKNGFRSYKVGNHQELRDGDEERRATYCETIMDKANENRNFLYSLCYTDECTFTLHNEPNVQNFRHWSKDKPTLQNLSRTQYPQKVNVWAGILGSHIIGPYFIEGTLNGPKYLDLLETVVGPRLTELNMERIWFQQDGCPAHNVQIVKEYLDNSFPDSWIGLNGPINWPARSPDLSPLDFFLWGHLKSKIYGHYELTTLEDLKAAIRNECRLISNRQLSNVRQQCYDRLGFCLAQNGGHFEYLL